MISFDVIVTVKPKIIRTNEFMVKRDSKTPFNVTFFNVYIQNDIYIDNIQVE